MEFFQVERPMTWDRGWVKYYNANFETLNRHGKPILKSLLPRRWRTTIQVIQMEWKIQILTRRPRIIQRARTWSHYRCIGRQFVLEVSAAIFGKKVLSINNSSSSKHTISTNWWMYFELCNSEVLPVEILFGDNRRFSRRTLLTNHKFCRKLINLKMWLFLFN